MCEKPGIIRLTVEEYEQCIAYALNKQTERMDAEIKIVKERKEKLRLALVDAGYPIPAGLNLEEWIPYIQGGGSK